MKKTNNNGVSTYNHKKSLSCKSLTDSENKNIILKTGNSNNIVL